MPQNDPTDLAAANDAALHEALRRHRLLGQLDTDARAAWAAQLAPRQHAAGDVVADGAALRARLFVLLAGRVTLAPEGGPDAGLVLEAPDWFGAGVTPAEGLAATVPEGALVASVAAEALPELLQAGPALRPFLAVSHPGPGAVVPAAEGEGGGEGDAAAETRAAADPHMNLMRTPVRDLIKRPPVTLPPDTSIRAAAELMREQRVSSVLLVERGHLLGLVTDRDLRNRALAAGLDPALPVVEIATVAPLTIEVGAPGFEALLLMARHNIHHVPVMDGTQVVGMVTATDVTEQHGTSAVYLAGEIHKQTTLEGLAACAARVKLLQRHLATAGASAYATGHIVTAITDALTVRLLHLAEARLGPAPVGWAWIAAGSQARHEQTAKSDQDNCMILDDAYDEALHGAYFKAFATWVCDGLAACGYVHCPGEMMAMTDAWRQPRRVWAEHFYRWVETPQPRALMLTCVFFDVRTVAGDAALLDGLRRDLLLRTKGNQLFLAHMVGNALSRQPPLGLFGGLSTIRSGEHKGTLDLKMTGIVPIIDLARVYALAAGHPAVNTHERLAHAAESHEINPQGVADLRDALEYLSTVRLRHQSRQLAAGHAADNYLDPEEISSFERGRLKHAFGVVKTLQDVLAQRYQSGRF